MQGFYEELSSKLAEAQVDFVIVGGVSAVLQGAPIVTFDFDICYRRSPENIAKLARVLAPYKPRLRGLSADLPNVVDEHTLQLGTNFTLEIGDEDVDFLGEMIAIGGYEQVIDKAREVEVAGHRVHVLCLEQLIETKRAAGRPKDLAAIPVLEATLRLQREEEPHESG